MGLDFLESVRGLSGADKAGATGFRVRLFGSLSATGKGHGSDRSVVAGLLGQSPETCSPVFLDDLDHPGSSHSIDIGGATFQVSLQDVIFDSVDHDFPYQNTLVIDLLKGTEVLFSREYYSVGGGFIKYKGQPEEERGEPTYPYRTSAQVEAILEKDKSLSLHQLVLENEIAITGTTKDEIYAKLDSIIDLMDKSVSHGIATHGVLPGPLGLNRKAPELLAHSQKIPYGEGRLLVALDAYAFAAAEENAAGHIIVTSPTCGASGVIPAVIRVMRDHLHISHENIRRGLLAAVLVGFLCRENASIAGAEVGCQGEVGVASAMGAALLAHAKGYSYSVVSNAAETALEHHLGLTCDPVGGYVQVPCIERNGMGAVKAFNAYVIAAAVVPGHHIVGLDSVIEAMWRTGRDMCPKYKETSTGGLATLVHC